MADKRDYKKWTIGDEKKLLELNAQGMHDGEIAKELDRSAASVRKRREKLGKPKVPDERLIRKYVAELAYRLGIPEDRAARRIAAMYRRGVFDDV